MGSPVLKASYNIPLIPRHQQRCLDHGDVFIELTIGGLGLTLTTMDMSGGPAYASIKSLLEWCSDNGVRIHPNLTVRVQPHDEERGIFASGSIRARAELLAVPREAWLTVSTVAERRRVEAGSRTQPLKNGTSQLPGLEELALSLLSEFHLNGIGHPSHWAAYLDTLPQWVHSPLWYHEAERAALRGSEVLLKLREQQHSLAGSWQRIAASSQQERHLTAVDALGGAQGQARPFTRVDVFWALSVIRSRRLRTWRGSALIPLAGDLRIQTERRVFTPKACIHTEGVYSHRRRVFTPKACIHTEGVYSHRRRVFTPKAGIHTEGVCTPCARHVHAVRTHFQACAHTPSV